MITNVYEFRIPTEDAKPHHVPAPPRRALVDWTAPGATKSSFHLADRR